MVEAGATQLGGVKEEEGLRVVDGVSKGDSSRRGGGKR